MKRFIIGLDFDGTLVEHKYPEIGEDIGAIHWLWELEKLGASLILHTMRSGTELDEAVKWLSSRGVSLFGINENPEQHTWTNSPKPYCNIYVDDAAFGCPLIHVPNAGPQCRPYVDWYVVGPKLVHEVTISLGELRG